MNRDELTALLGNVSTTHRITADLTITNDQVSGTIRIRPTRREPAQPRGAVGPTPRSGPVHVTSQHLPGAGGPAITVPETERDARNAAFRALRSLQIDNDTAIRLAATYAPERIADVCRAALGKTSPAGYTVTCLQRGWRTPTNGNRTQETQT